MNSPRVIVANLSAPEINRLASELARRNVLSRYVRPYTNKGRVWEQLIERTPKLNRLYARTLGRRLPPEGLPLDKVAEAGVMQDFAAAILGRVRIASRERRSRWAHSLAFAAEHAVAKAAGRYSEEADIVVASYGAGLEAFEVMRRTGGRAVLNYPIAHNRFQREFYREEAQLSPEFAAALPNFDIEPPDHEKRLDAECAAATRILVGSTFARRSFIGEGFAAEKITAIPYGVDPSRFAPGSALKADGIFRVLFVGQLGQRKGISYLFRAYELFRRPDTELHLVGSFVSGSEVYDRYRGLYRHTPNVPQKQLPDIYRQADVFVFPTLVEGMGLTVLEAMACGLPVIVTPNGPADVVRDGVDGYVVPIRDPEAVASRLEQLFKDRALREQMGRNAREQALRHTWEVYARRAADVVLNLEGESEKGIAA